MSAFKKNIRVNLVNDRLFRREVKNMMSCEHYDYIEIACMHQYPIKLTFTDGTDITGQACDTALNNDRKECIKIKDQQGEQLVCLDNIISLEVMTDNPHFHLVRFN